MRLRRLQPGFAPGTCHCDVPVRRKAPLSCRYRRRRRVLFGSNPVNSYVLCGRNGKSTAAAPELREFPWLLRTLRQRFCWRIDQGPGSLVMAVRPVLKESKAMRFAESVSRVSAGVPRHREDHDAIQQHYCERNRKQEPRIYF